MYIGEIPDAAKWATPAKIPHTHRYAANLRASYSHPGPCTSSPAAIATGFGEVELSG